MLSCCIRPTDSSWKRLFRVRRRWQSFRFRASLKHLSTSTPAMTAQAQLTEPPSPKTAKESKVPTTSKARQKKFNRHFPAVDEDEKVLNREFLRDCALRKINSACFMPIQTIPVPSSATSCYRVTCTLPRTISRSTRTCSDTLQR